MMDKIFPLLQCPRTIHLLLRPRFAGSAGVQGLPAVGTGRFLPLRWVSLPMQWWPVALKPHTYGAQPRQKAEGASGQAPSPGTPRGQREAHAPRTQRKDGAKGALTKGAAFATFAAWKRSGEALVSSGSWEEPKDQNPGLRVQGREEKRAQESSKVIAGTGTYHPHTSAQTLI